MSRAAVAPSIIDDVGFLDQLDKLEPVAAPEVDVLSAYWDHALRTDAADESRLPVLAPEPAALAPEPPVRHVRSAQTVRPIRFEKGVRPEKTSGRIAAPGWPEPAVRPEMPVQLEWPLRPEHLDEIGEPVTVDAMSTAPPRHVPLSLATLMVVFCLGVGAGSAALVFHDRVAQIVVTWSK
jgi:hypothetical protein